MTVWFTSDSHFGHANIIKYANRPFASAEEMDEAMVERWNEVVKIQDHVWHLGDVSMTKSALETVTRLNGKKRLLFGNHDVYDINAYRAVGFQKFGSVRRFNGIIFSHYPLHEGSLFTPSVLGNAHGHIHQHPAPTPRHLNISVEQTGYAPISLEEVTARVKQRLEDFGLDS